MCEAARLRSNFQIFANRTGGVLWVRQTTFRYKEMVREVLSCSCSDGKRIESGVPRQESQTNAKTLLHTLHETVRRSFDAAAA